MSLAARHLEANGIPTVVIGAARDIVEQAGVPRFVFNDLPLGNPCGVPWDESMQAATVEMALDLLESARYPRTTVQTPFRWPDGHAWRQAYMRVDETNREALRRAVEESRARRARERSAG